MTQFEQLHEVKRSSTLEAKMALALNKVLAGELAKSINLVEERLGKHDNVLLGRQVAWMIYEHYTTSEQDAALVDIIFFSLCELLSPTTVAIHAVISSVAVVASYATAARPINSNPLPGPLAHLI